MSQPTVPDRTTLAPGLVISRLVTGLWQVADMERNGRRLDQDRAAADLAAYAETGFDTFDMADHYGSAEEIAGRFNRMVADGAVRTISHTQPVIFTKWCPPPGPMTPDVVRAAVQRALDRLQATTIDLMQFHWWTFQHPAWLDAMRELAKLRDEGLIGHLGTTNFDTDHLHVLAREGIRIATNQVCFSLLDRRAAEDLSAFCAAEGVKLLAYGTLAGGLLTEKWLGKGEPGADAIADWSTMKYKRFVDAIGGWDVLQTILKAESAVAKRHGVSMANVATRWVLEQPAVAAVIVGARLGEREHRDDNLRLFTFTLDDADRALFDQALTGAKRLPGDCGSEYRRPPFLTATGDLSLHLASLPKVYAASPTPDRPNRLRIDTDSVWEPICGYSRAVRIGDRILVSGTTATHGSGEIVCRGDPRGQAVYILDKIDASIEALGGAIEDVVRTRVYVRDQSQWEAVARVHGRYFGHVRPANTLVEISSLVGDYEVEIEAEAVVG
jgi:aryl-alcohol dehydrogenase-like predicted oxidoreductase/enamine deaminase RidA (YjgF/YER057c/UK114 family)